MTMTAHVQYCYNRLGFTLQKAGDGRGVVCRVQPDSMASALDVRVGDVLTGINKRRCAGATISLTNCTFVIIVYIIILYHRLR
jgi:C-terminal processing protease CtpA/Prc